MAHANFAHALKTARKAAGLTQTELGRLAGLTGSYISMLEKGRRNPPAPPRIRRLCAALGIPAGPMLETAALERAPHLRRRVERAAREGGAVRRERDRLLTTSLYHIAHRPGPLNAMASFLDLSPGERTLMGRLLGRLRRIPSPSEAAKRSAEVLEEIPSEARAKLARSLPGMLDAQQRLPVDEDPVATDQDDKPTPPTAPGSQAPRVVPLPVFTALADALGSGDAGDGDVRYLDAALAPAGAFLWKMPDDRAWPRLAAGDLLIVDPARDPEGGDLVAFLHGGEAMLGRFRRRGDSVELECEGRDGPPLRQPADAFGFVGVVLGLTRSLA